MEAATVAQLYIVQGWRSALHGDVLIFLHSKQHNNYTYKVDLLCAPED